MVLFLFDPVSFLLKAEEYGRLPALVVAEETLEWREGKSALLLTVFTFFFLLLSSEGLRERLLDLARLFSFDGVWYLVLSFAPFMAEQNMA